MTYAAIERDINEKRELLAGYLSHVPPKVRDGSWNTATEFKKHIAEARRVHGKRNVTLGELSSAINKLHLYWS
jgi:hypothetical protein